MRILILGIRKYFMTHKADNGLSILSRPDMMQCVPWGWNSLHLGYDGTKIICQLLLCSLIKFLVSELFPHLYAVARPHADCAPSIK